jgi:hypothetical protein
MGVRDTGKPVIAITLSRHFPSVSKSSIMPPAVGVSTGVARIVQHPKCRRRGEVLEDQELRVAHTGRKQEAFLLEDLDCLAGRADPQECLEEVSDGLPDLGIWVKHYVTKVVVHEAGW